MISTYYKHQYAQAFRALDSGGKAGKGANKTTSIRVQLFSKDGRLVDGKYVRFKLGDGQSFMKAKERAIKLCREHIAKVVTE
jgi:hypothetical protein